MKKGYIVSSMSFIVVFIVCIAYFTTLLLGTCQSLYYRSLRMLIIRNKYRLCVHILRTTSKSSCTNPIEQPIISCAQYEVKKAIKPTRKTVILSTESFGWPLKIGSFWISSLFGPRKKKDGSLGFHTGIDLAAPKGTPIYASRSGKVLQAQDIPGYGKTIVMEHETKFKTRYAHLDKIHVSKGSWINKYSIIGEVGDTGFVRKEGLDGSHLHFEVYEYEKQVNPMQFLPKLV